MMSIEHYLTLGALLMCIAVAGIFINRKNVIILLMCIELMLLSVNMNFVAFSRFGGFSMDGQMMALLVVMLAAAEAAVAMAIVLRIFHDFGSIDITRTDSLRD